MQTNVTYIAKGHISTPCIFLTTNHPRKELLDYLHAKHAEKIYITDDNGNSRHVGYIIGGIWYTLYQVSGRGPR